MGDSHTALRLKLYTHTDDVMERQKMSYSVRSFGMFVPLSRNRDAHAADIHIYGGGA